MTASTVHPPLAPPFGEGDSPRCRLCGSAALAPSARFSTRDWRLLTCSDCAVSYVEPIPDPESLAPYYEYESYGKVVYGRSEAAASVRVRAFEQLLGEAGRHGLRAGRLLDVGCSNGLLLSAAARSGWQVEGIELDPETARVAHERTGARVRQGSGLEVLAPDERFDAITMSHWLEHTTEPMRQLTIARAHLAQGGGILLRVPNARGKVASLLGPAWRWFTPPVHLFYFAPRSFEVAADRLGLELRWVSERQGDAYAFPVELAWGMLHRYVTPRPSRGPASPSSTPGGPPVYSTVRLSSLADLSGRANPFRRWEDTELVVLLTLP